VSAVLSVAELSKHYGELRALREISFEVARGEMVAVIGPNGAGKTTLLSIIAGVQSASSGSVEPGPEHVGWAPQQPALYSRLSVRENLELFARLEGIPDRRGAVERMLEQTGLRDRAGERVSRLSGGNRQRVNVALALIADPPLLVLDEPSSSLDPAQRERLWSFIAGLAGAGTTVLFSTHNVAEAERHADRVLVLAEGALLLDGTAAELKRQAGQDSSGDFEGAFVGFLRAAGQTESAR
jgi:ABC-2 type transport system ATP-binding protein